MQGVTANVIDVVIETGDAGPVTPIGINLPNEQEVREQYGSKSVSISNVNEAYDRSMDDGFRSEFAWSPDEVARARKWQGFAHELATDLHEVIGHASGKMHPNLGCSPQTVLKEQYSAIEESRADLVALYFLPDPKLVEMGLIRAEDHDDVVRAEYENYARTPLVQLRRIREGTTIEEDHMRNRQMIVHWLMANTKAIEKRTRDGKTYYVMLDPKAFRDGVGRLLAEVQRIKANGDYPAAKALFDTYGIHFDSALRDQIVARVDKLNLPSYTGFVQPKLEPVRDADGTIRDVSISYPRDLTRQMLEYSEATRQQPRAVPCFEPLMFSSRLRQAAGRNRLAVALDRRRAAGLPIIDLTLSNPTRAGLAYPNGLLAPMVHDRSLRYEPEPFGLLSARHAVSDDFARRGLPVPASRIVLTASTSEAYSLLFKLLCDPGDAVLAPRPSYPLVEHLTDLDGVDLEHYRLEFHGRWELDLQDLREKAGVRRMRAIIMISPNNPTGSVVTDAELVAMAAIARDNDLALISDEVFTDYPICRNTAGQRASPADGADVHARRFVEIRRPSPGQAGLDCRRRPCRARRRCVGAARDHLRRLSVGIDACPDRST